ncbi:hypothetical protein BLOT_006719 [Blomia tropicalis]|nr:hypothetical protein BLOT_006719 [Blomia tropicalis]
MFVTVSTFFGFVSIGDDPKTATNDCVIQNLLIIIGSMIKKCDTIKSIGLIAILCKFYQYRSNRYALKIDFLKIYNQISEYENGNLHSFVNH